MKKYLIPIIALVFLTMSPSSAKEKVEKEKEKAAIKKVIEETTNAYKAKDFDRIAKTYVQDETTVRLVSNKNGFFLNKDWKEIGPKIKQNFENNPYPITRKYEKINYTIKVYDKSAWAIHDELQFLDTENKYKQIIVHFLEKNENDEWKVVFISVVAASSWEM